jgi:hypothetical protein
MNELNALATMRDGLPEASPEVLATVRSQLTNLEVPPLVPVHAVRRNHRWRRRAFASAAAAAAVAAAVVLSVTVGTTDRQPPLGSPGRVPGSSAVDAPPMRTVSQVLDVAAAYALRDGRTLSAGQYRYVRTHSLGLTTVGSPPANGAYQFTEYTSELWLPQQTSGTRFLKSTDNQSVSYATEAQREWAARQMPGGLPKPGVEWMTAQGDQEWQPYPPGSVSFAVHCLPTPCHASTVWDRPTAALLAEAPRDVQSLRADLFAYAQSQQDEAVKYGKSWLTVEDAAYSAAARLIGQGEVPDDLRAVLYQVVKTIPGVAVVPSLANYDNVSGIAVAKTDSWGVEHDLIFGSDGSYLGDKSVVVHSSEAYKLPAGTVIGYSAVTYDVQAEPAIH